MAETTLNMKLLLRRAAFADTCVLAAGEPGCFLDLNADGSLKENSQNYTFKVGDGETIWANLPIANKTQIDALIKVTDDKVEALSAAINKLNETYATDAEVEGIRAALDAAKLDKATYEAYVATHALTDTEINTAIGNVDAKFANYALKTDVATEFAKYTTTTAQQAIDAEQDRRIDVLEAKPFDTYATKTEVQGVAGDVTKINQELDTFGDIVTHNAEEFETSGAAAAAEGRINAKLEGYYTKLEADAAFTTPAEVISEVNKALADVSDADSISNITTLVNYVNEHGSDLTELITEVYGSAEMTGDSRLDIIEVKPAMGIISGDIQNWNATKSTVDTNKATWDKAGTALQPGAISDGAVRNMGNNYVDVAFEDEGGTGATITSFGIKGEGYVTVSNGTINSEPNAGGATSAAVISVSIPYASENAEGLITLGAEGGAERYGTAAQLIQAENLGQYAKTAELGTMSTKDAGDYYTKAEVDGIVAGLDHEDTTYTVEATANALEFTVTPNGKGQVQTVTLVAPTVDTGVMDIEAGEDISVTPGENGKVTIAHETFTTGKYTKDPATSDKDGDQYFFTSVVVDNGHVTGANVKSLASVLEAMTFVFDGGTSAN